MTGIWRKPATGSVRTPSRELVALDIDSGPVFRRVNRHGHIGDDRLSDRAVALRIKHHVQRLGYDPDTFSGPSLRRGFATQASGPGRRR